MRQRRCGLSISQSELWWSVWSWGQWTPSSLEGQGDPLCEAWRERKTHQHINLEDILEKETQDPAQWVQEKVKYLRDSFTL